VHCYGIGFSLRDHWTRSPHGGRKTLATTADTIYPQFAWKFPSTSCHGPRLVSPTRLGRRHQGYCERWGRRQGTIIATGTSTRQFDRGYATGIDSGPSLKEVARADAELDRAREESLELTRHQTKQVNQEVRELVQAKNASIQEVERLQEQDEKRLREAFARSNRIDEITHEEEERMLQQALESSQQELATDKELEQALQEALSQSLAENAAFTSGGENHHEEEERMIQQAIAMSLLCD